MNKKLSLFDLVCIGINAIVGSGIYAFPGILISLLGSGSFWAFIVCGIASLLIGLCFAETATQFDRSGGPYVYAKAAFGNHIGYAVGWSCWAAAVLSWAAVTTALIPYLEVICPVLIKHEILGIIAGLFITASLGAINYIGVKPGAYLTDFLTIAKLLPLFVLTFSGFYFFDTRLLSSLGDTNFHNLPKATLITFFAFQGFEVVPVPAGESTSPRRNAPLAVLGSVIGATLLYVAIQFAAMGSTANIAGSKDPLALMGQSLMGPLGGQIIAISAVISMLGFCAGVALAGPRYIEAIASDGFLPDKLAAYHPKFDTPYRAILLTTCITMLLIIFLNFDRLVDLSVLIVAIQYLSTCLAVPFLRRRKMPHSQIIMRLPGGITIPTLAILVVIVFLVVPAFYSGDIRQTIWLAALIGIGAIPITIWKGFQKIKKI